MISGMFHGLRPRVGVVLQNTAVLLKLGLLVLFLGFAFVRIPSHSWHGESLANVDLHGWALVVALASSLVWISLSYSGFNAAVYVAEEAKNPTRTVPRALFLGTLSVWALYVLLNAVFVYAAPVEPLHPR